MWGLQLHQLRVAAGADLLMEHPSYDVDTRTVILACLSHDMGNIIKSDPSLFPEFLEPEGIAHWRLVKREFQERYGNDEHAATLAICKEIGLSEAALSIIRAIGFLNIPKTRRTGTPEPKIVEYADLRVSPHGTLSLIARLREAQARYLSKPDGIMPSEPNIFDEYLGHAIELESQLFVDAALAPSDITEAAVTPRLEALRQRPLHV